VGCDRLRRENGASRPLNDLARPSPKCPKRSSDRTSRAAQNGGEAPLFPRSAQAGRRRRDPHAGHALRDAALRRVGLTAPRRRAQPIPSTAAATRRAHAAHRGQKSSKSALSIASGSRTRPRAKSCRPSPPASARLRIPRPRLIHRKIRDAAGRAASPRPAAPSQASTSTTERAGDRFFQP